jgi:hypothetical protein
MEFHPVVSSTIKSIGYQQETENIKSHLTVIFNSGARYTYTGVPLDLWVRLKEAESVGRFFAQEIKPIFEGVKE